jgi:SAM-dependent methyltransferase
VYEKAEETMKKALVFFLTISLYWVCLSSGAGQATEAPQEITLDVPYVPSPQPVVDEMLRICEVKKDDLLFDLGCGDGRIVITAAQRFGCRGVGIDLNPLRIKESKENATKAEVNSLVNFYEQDLFKTDFHEATVLTLYLLSSVNLKLRPKILSELRPGTRVVSHNYGMSEWQADKTTSVVVNETTHTVYFWVIPANVTGTWDITLHTKSKKGPLALRLEQVFQNVQGIAFLRETCMPLQDAKLTGDKLQFKLVFKGKEKDEVLLFEGQVNGNMGKGTVKLGEGTTVIEGSWQAKRDPSTIKPIDKLKVN